jgi:hypothetical protein
VPFAESTPALLQSLAAWRDRFLGFRPLSPIAFSSFVPLPVHALPNYLTCPSFCRPVGFPSEITRLFPSQVQDSQSAVTSSLAYAVPSETWVLSAPAVDVSSKRTRNRGAISAAGKRKGVKREKFRASAKRFPRFELQRVKLVRDPKKFEEAADRFHYRWFERSKRRSVHKAPSWYRTSHGHTNGFRSLDCKRQRQATSVFVRSTLSFAQSFVSVTPRTNRFLGDNDNTTRTFAFSVRLVRLNNSGRKLYEGQGLRPDYKTICSTHPPRLPPA